MPTNHEEPNRRRLFALLSAAGLLAIPLLLIWWPGCKTYPEVTSQESLHLMRLLYAACNTKDTVRLTRVETELQQAIVEGKITPKEQEAFAKIIKQAKANEWEAAEKAAFKFAQDQVR